jgi:putative acyl-CoA dehydrogenase
VLRAIARDPATLDAYWAEVELAAGADQRLDDSIAGLRKECDDLDQIETRARRLVEHLATVFQGSLLVRHAPEFVADAFCASRLNGDTGRAFGTLPVGVDAHAIVERTRPRVA